MEFMNRLYRYSEETGSLWNLEASPAEGLLIGLLEWIKNYILEYIHRAKMNHIIQTQLVAGDYTRYIRAIELQENCSLYTLEVQYTWISW